MLSAKDPPPTIKIAMLIGLVYAAGPIAIGLGYLSVGALFIIFPSPQEEAGLLRDGLLLIGSAYFAVGTAILLADLVLAWGINGGSIVGWLLGLLALGGGLLFDVPNTIGKPWWVGLNAQRLVSHDSTGPDPLTWIAAAISPDVHIVLLASIAVMLLWPPTLRWLFSRRSGTGLPRQGRRLPQPRSR